MEQDKEIQLYIDSEYRICVAFKTIVLFLAHYSSKSPFFYRTLL